MSGFVILGGSFAMIGISMLAMAMPRLNERQPKHVAMLIGGMMATAFGIVLAGFAIAYTTASPLALNSAVSQ